MTYILLFGLSAVLAGCDDCDLSGYAPLRVQMISAAPAPPTTWDGCAAGMDNWSDACWGQFYAVLGHEVAHGWLGSFHA